MDPGPGLRGEVGVRRRDGLHGWLVSALLLAAAAGVRAQPALDPALDAYVPEVDLRGTLTSAGSDTMLGLMERWLAEFARLHPGVEVALEAEGSSTAPVALVEGTAMLGPMSRRMHAGEIARFERRFGHRPTGFRVAVDALAVFVHADNPIAGLTLPEVDAIFSSTRRCGRFEAVERWGQLGLEGVWWDRPVQRFGRNSVSGTHGYFRDSALCGGEFEGSLVELPNSAAVVEAVAADPGAIGYSGIGYQSPGVRAVPVARRPGVPFVDVTAENAVDGLYPLSRYLYVYVDRPPDAPLAPLTRAFLQYVLSAAGQAVVLRDGYVPLPAKVVQRERALL